MKRRRNKKTLLGILVFVFIVSLVGQVNAGDSTKLLAPITETMIHATRMVVSGQGGNAQDVATHANAVIMLVRKIVFDLPKDNPHVMEAVVFLNQAIEHLQQALTYGFKGDAASTHTHANEGLLVIEHAAMHLEPSHYAKAPHVHE